MGVLMSLLRKIGHFLLAVLRVLRKTLCCKRLKSESEPLLPLTLHITQFSVSGEDQMLTFQEWNPWDEDRKTDEPNTASNNSNGSSASLNNSVNKDALSNSNEDFFRDMVPKIKKPKKIMVKEQIGDQQSIGANSSRLAMDTSRFSLPGTDLGLIESGFSNWEESENNEGLWDPDSLIREKRLSDREKRIAEHQRRKQEKEGQKRAALKLAESNEKTKSS